MDDLEHLIRDYLDKVPGDYWRESIYEAEVSKCDKNVSEKFEKYITDNLNLEIELFEEYTYTRVENKDKFYNIFKTIFLNHPRLSFEIRHL